MLPMAAERGIHYALDLPHEGKRNLFRLKASGNFQAWCAANTCNPYKKQARLGFRLRIQTQTGPRFLPLPRAPYRPAPQTCRAHSAGHPSPLGMPLQLFQICDSD